MIVKGSSEGLAEQLKNQSVGAALLIGANDAFWLLWAACVYLSVNACIASATHRVVRLTNDSVANTQGDKTVNGTPPLDAYANVSSISTSAAGIHTDVDSQALYRTLADEKNAVENHV